MIRALVVLTLALAVSCGPVPKPTVEAPPLVVSPRRLVEVYRSEPTVADAAYTNRRVRVRLTAYVPVQGGVGYEWGMDGASPVIVFLGQRPPEDNRPLTVEGTCRGRVMDGRTRGAGIRWYLMVDGCTIRPAP
jgi:hypothetical protein